MQCWQCSSCRSEPGVLRVWVPNKFSFFAFPGGIINPSNPTKPGDEAETYLKFEKDGHKHMDRRTLTVQCFPVYSLLLALGNPTVHYFSLDIEGAELKVLETIPWDKVGRRTQENIRSHTEADSTLTMYCFLLSCQVDIKILDIEMNHVGEIFEGQARHVKRLLERAGYDFFRTAVIDHFYVKRGFQFDRESAQKIK